MDIGQVAVSHKRGRDKLASKKRVLIELNREAYCNLVEVAFDAMLKCALYAERNKLTRFADTLPVLWPKETTHKFIDVMLREIP